VPGALISATLLFAFLLVIAAMYASYTSSKTVVETARAVERSQEMLAGLESLQVVLSDIYLSAQSYSRSKDKRNLAEFRHAKSALASHLDFISRLSSQDLRIRQHLTYLVWASRSLQQETEELMLVNDGQKSEIARKLKDARDLLTLIHNRMSLIHTEEKLTLESRLKQFKTQTDDIKSTYMVLVGTMLTFSLVLVLMIRHYLITARAASEADRKALHEIISHAPIGIVRLSVDFEIIESNPVFSAYCRLPATQLRGRKLFELVPDLPQAEFSNVASTGKSYQKERILVALRNETKLMESYWDVAIWPALEQRGDRSFVMMVVDTSDKVLLQNQRQVFSESVTHDMKSPLIGSSYIIKSLEDGSLTPQQSEMLRELKKSNEKVLRMVKDLLELTKYDSKVLLNNEIFDCVDVLRECITELQPLCKQQQVQIRLTVQDAGADSQIYADKGAVGHLLSNLIENAIKFSNSEGTVSVVLRGAENDVVVEIIDEGPGLSEYDKRRLFTRFWQGDCGKQIPSGTGLGLYLCYRIATTIGGSIKIGDNDSGTTFIVSLPRPAANMPEPSLDGSILNLAPPEDDEKLFLTQTNTDEGRPR
jgi:signal transduction histidine kinase/CHASE3 domain sensor protein